MMQPKMLYAWCVMVFMGAVGAAQSVTAATNDGQANDPEVVIANPTMSEVAMRTFRLPEQPMQTVYYNTSSGQGVIAGGTEPIGSENPVYINQPPPSFAFAPGAGRLIADDIITVAVGGCSVTGYEIIVGRSPMGCSLNGAACETNSDCGGSQTCIPRADPGFTVDFGIYDNCPMAGGSLVAGTEGTMTFTEDGTYTILVDFSGTPTPLGSTFWIGVEFDKAGAGWVVGTPATRGFTENIYDFPIPFFACKARFTGSPIYAGFHARVFCSPEPPFEREFLAYYNPELIAPTFAPGANAWIVDDVELIVDDCVMSSYQIGAVGGGGPFTVTAEIWRLCSQTTKIAGTEGTFQAVGDNSPELALFTFPEGVDLGGGANFYVAWRYSSSNAAAILAEEPTLGMSDDLFGLPAQGGCLFFFGGNPQASFNLAIRCLGDAPVGACCDLSQVNDVGDPVGCREVSEISCQGTLSRYSQGADCPNTCTIDGMTCEDDSGCPNVCSDSFTLCSGPGDCPAGETCESQVCVDFGESFDPACGTSACCTPPEYQFGEGCFELTIDQCAAIMDDDGNSAVWTRGVYCDNAEFNCPRWECRFAEGACDIANGSPGCNNPQCCDKICDQDNFCCLFDWDQQCADRAIDPDFGCELPLTYDDCNNPDPSLGAIEVDISTSRCGNNNAPCEEDEDCTPGVCNLPSVLLETTGAMGGVGETFCCSDIPGGSLPGGVWAKFQAPATSVVITAEDGGLGDSSNGVLQLFAVGDNSSEEAACNSLIPIGCDNDSGVGNQPRLVASDLVVNNTYYLLLAPRSADFVGIYRVEFEVPAPPQDPRPANDLCDAAIQVSVGGDQPLDLTNARVECPWETCFPSSPDNPTPMDNDVWYSYFPLASGLLRVDTCDLGEDTTIVAYETGSCPPTVLDRIACNTVAASDCDIVFNVTGGNSVLVRVGGVDGSEPVGFVHFSDLLTDCNSNGIPDDEDIMLGNSEDCQPNGIPDECDGGCNAITITGSIPPVGQIDARQPTSPDGSTTFGWDEVILNFDGDTSGVAMGDITVSTVPAGPAPAVCGIASAGNDLTVTLCSPIPPGAWTVIEHTPSGTSTCLGFLPADVNGDRTSGPGDILAVIDSLNGVTPRPVSSTDADRSNVAGPEDIIRVIDLLNGAATFDTWIDASLPVSPCN